MTTATGDGLKPSPGRAIVTSGPPGNVAPGTAAADRRQCCVLGRPRSAATRASCVLAWRRLRLGVPGTTFPGNPLAVLLNESAHPVDLILQILLDDRCGLG